MNITENREKKIQSVTIWGALANLLLSVGKLIAGFIGHSGAMLADAVHSLSDLVSDFVLLIMVKVASKGVDKGHDYGHGKFETLATAIISLLLIVAGAKLLGGGVENIKAVIEGEPIQSPGKIALWAALISIAVKEILYQWTAAVGKRLNSPAMISNAWHHRTDALSSIASALGIGMAVFFGGKWAILDPLVCCGISIFIVYVAVKMAMPALGELTEASLPEDMQKNILSILSAVEGVRSVHALKTRKIGPGISVECHLVVDPQMSVAEAHGITEAGEAALRKAYGPETQISIHVEPSEDAK